MRRASRLHEWWRRPTLRILLQNQLSPTSSLSGIDDRANNETRLPDDEEVHLGGVTLIEAFTPSTIG